MMPEPEAVQVRVQRRYETRPGVITYSAGMTYGLLLCMYVVHLTLRLWLQEMSSSVSLP
jgi:hypothetical protein